MDVDVVVVGGGPVGLLAALGLARAGLGVTVLEQGHEIGREPRAMVYSYPTLEGFADLGILEDVEARGLRARVVNHIVHRTGEHIPFAMDVLDGVVPHPYNVHLGQDGLSEIVLEHLRGHPRAAVETGAAVTGLVQDGSGVTVEVGGARSLRAGWVVGADGARSSVRSALGLAFEGMTWPERYVAANVDFDFAAHGHQDTNMLIDPQVGGIVARIDTGTLWRCTYAEDAQLPEATIPERMREHFARAMPGGEQPEVVAWAHYRMHQRAAERFRSGRVLLAGDAAHVTNTTGAMGLNSGCLDTFVLAEALAAVITGEAGEEVLDRYAELRRAAFLERVSPVASELKRLVYHSTDPARLEEDLAGLRAVAADPERRRERFLFLRGIATPSLVRS
jgi:3-(3-hydroxy-phenyl)propionate hydroxylase/6-hydroxy-3-succinoylpyridine 3-monooxygenase